jgi:transposase
MTIDGWLPITAIRQGYFNGNLFYDWIITRLVPTLRARNPGRTMVIVLENCSIHYSYEARLTQALLDAGFLLQFLPPYSPDYNPIELTFHVLKSWIRRSHMYLRSHYQTY